MIFAVLFVLAFLFGLGIYWFTRKWVTAVAITVMVFCMSAVFDQSANAISIKFTLLFGVPIVFFASLLGCYVIQIRTPDEFGEAVSETDHPN